jgi:hypothetical protein
MFVVFGLVRAFHATGGGIRFGFLWYVPILTLSWMLGAVVASVFSEPCDRWLRGYLLKAASDLKASEALTTG